MGRKFAVELDDNIYNDLTKAYKDALKLAPNGASFSFEEFLSQLLQGYAETKKQMDQLGESWKGMMNSLDSNGLGEMLKSFMEANKAGSESKPSKKEEVVDEDEEIEYKS